MIPVTLRLLQHIPTDMDRIAGDRRSVILGREWKGTRFASQRSQWMALCSLQHIQSSSCRIQLPGVSFLDFPARKHPGYRHTLLIFTLVSGNDRFLIRISLLQSISVQGSSEPRSPPFPMIPVLITCVALDVPASTRRTDMVHFHALYVLRSVSR